MVSVFEPLVWALRFPMISTRASRVNNVESLMLKFALMLVIWMASSLEQ